MLSAMGMGPANLSERLLSSHILLPVHAHVFALDPPLKELSDMSGRVIEKFESFANFSPRAADRDAYT